MKTSSSSDVISAFWDMMPTLCDITGIPSPKTKDKMGLMQIGKQTGYEDTDGTLSTLLLKIQSD